MSLLHKKHSAMSVSTNMSDRELTLSGGFVLTFVMTLVVHMPVKVRFEVCILAVEQCLLGIMWVN